MRYTTKTVVNPSGPVILSIFDLRPKAVGSMLEYSREMAIQAARVGWTTVNCYAAPLPPEVAEYLALPNVRLDLLPEPCRNNPEQMKLFWRLVRRHRPRVVHLHFTGFVNAYYWLARLGGVKRVYFTDHSSRAESAPPRPDAFWKRTLKRIINAPLDTVFCISRYNHENMLALGILPASRCRVLYNGSRLPEGVAPDEHIREFRRQYAIPDGRPIVLQVGQVIPEKGVPDQLDAARIVLRETRDVQFVFAGDGRSRQEYAALAARDAALAGNVTFTGRIAGSLAPAYSSALVTCQVSRWQEGFGATIAEAMAYSRAVIGTRAGAIPELIVEGETGFLVPPAAPPALAGKILQLLRDPALAARMGQAGRRRAEACFDLRSQIATLLAAYEK